MGLGVWFDFVDSNLSVRFFVVGFAEICVIRQDCARLYVRRHRTNDGTKRLHLHTIPKAIFFGRMCKKK